MLQKIGAFHILIYAVVVVHGPVIAFRRVQQVFAIGYIRSVISQCSKDCGHNVYLLRRALQSANRQSAGRVEKDYRDTVAAYVGEV